MLQPKSSVLAKLLGVLVTAVRQGLCGPTYKVLNKHLLYLSLSLSLGLPGQKETYHSDEIQKMILL